ncbi:MULTISPECIES: tannase/feruloyl esterase family alpha/beta hydrolase [Pigmentiphaga]|uniref:Feruloyl esterase n=1 Tax=Pigmentiphaga daeguensis TaxID=414049 RepID=A0ABN1C687_9BURK|nr:MULTISPECIES: tannase/feruloyl esterase family alpha/beta hydrolase [unclassified Pigmentiphaga]OVZ66411.1 tannase/feruloyl esterase family alpha/beta hydrolase [Pigmentiphaga sp. NML030171]
MDFKSLQPSWRMLRRGAGCLAISAGIAGCGGGDGNDVAREDPAAPLACDDSLRTGFRPDDQTTVLMVRQFRQGDPLLLSGTPTASTPVATADVCMVKLNVGPGNAGPKDAPSTSAGIGIEVWLPGAARWNHRIHLKGGGGWAGGVHGDTTQLAGTGTDGAGGGNPATVAQQEGAVSASTDTGHANTANFGSFAMNPDGSLNLALLNDFSERSIFQLVTKTKALAKAYYGKAAAHTYWNGFSTGGRQGMKAAQKFPEQFDGILAGAPAINWSRFSTSHLHPQVVFERDLGGHRFTAEQEQLVSTAAVAACDMVGGTHLGYVPDPASCRYDPTTDPSVLCAADGGANASAACITREQAVAFNKIWYGQTDDGTAPSPEADNGWSVSLAAGQRWYGPPRGSSLANFLRGPTPNSASQVALQLENGAYAPASFINARGDGRDLWRTFTHDWLAYAYDRGLALQEQFAFINTDTPDLSALRDHGTKLLMYHGLADSLIKPGGSMHYYNRVMRAMGGYDAIQGFYRFYLVPGMFHGFVNGSPNADAAPPLPTNDQLYRALTDWVEKGIAPARLEISSKASAEGSPPKTWPLCLYPQQARYVSGNPLVASSYNCS